MPGAAGTPSLMRGMRMLAGQCNKVWHTHSAGWISNIVCGTEKRADGYHAWCSRQPQLEGSRQSMNYVIRGLQLVRISIKLLAACLFYFARSART